MECAHNFNNVKTNKVAGIIDRIFGHPTESMIKCDKCGLTRKGIVKITGGKNGN